MNAAFEQNVRRALSVLHPLPELPSIEAPLAHWPPQVQHLGIVVLREALDIEIRTREKQSVRARMSAARKKAWADPEVRARMSAAHKKALADPEVRARMSAAHKKALADPEVRARMSAARKKQWAKFRAWKKEREALR